MRRVGKAWAAPRSYFESLSTSGPAPGDGFTPWRTPKRIFDIFDPIGVGNDGKRGVGF